MNMNFPLMNITKETLELISSHIYFHSHPVIYKYNLINSSLTADGARIPKSVNNNVRYAGGV